MSGSDRLLTKVRFEHGFIPELGMHRIMSPDTESAGSPQVSSRAEDPGLIRRIPYDIRGFHIMGKTYEEAEREALAMVALIQGRRASGSRGKLAAVEFEAA